MVDLAQTFQRLTSFTRSRTTSSSRNSPPLLFATMFIIAGVAALLPARLRAAEGAMSRSTAIREAASRNIDRRAEPVEACGEVVLASAQSTELLTPVTPTIVPTKSKTKSKTVRMLVTAYCACTKCCGPSAHGLTASGKLVTANRGRFVAADAKVFSFGTKLKIPGYNNGNQVEVLDRGGAIKGNHLDVFFSSHQKAMDWGKRWLDVTVE